MAHDLFEQRIDLGFFPTPLHPLDRLSKVLSPTEAIRIWVKRDDQSGLASGGNKARKLEYLAYEAVNKGATVLLTAGALQSNHARQTAAAAARLGLKCVLVLEPGALEDEDYAESGNMMLDRLFGAEIVLPGVGADVLAEMSDIADRLQSAGEKPYVIPIGGSNALGAVGYARCVDEIADAGTQFAEVFLATGSGGTQAGLIGGFAHAGYATDVVGISIGNAKDVQERKVRDILARLTQLLGTEVPPPAATLVDDRFIGPGYGVPTVEMRDAVALVARTEGLLLDPVYTGKGMAGLMSRIQEGSVPPGDILFLHTGGSAGLFAYRDFLTSRQ